MKKHSVQCPECQSVNVNKIGSTGLGSEQIGMLLFDYYMCHKCREIFRRPFNS